MTLIIPKLVKRHTNLSQVIALAKEGHYTVGYELNLWLVLYSRWRALWSGVYHNTEFHRRNLWKVVTHTIIM